MLRRLPVLAALLLFAPSGAAAPVKIRWHGQSMFEIVTSKGTRIITDPHALEEYPRKKLKADLVLMSHFHVDHTKTDAIENIKMARQINALKKDGPRIDWNDVDQKFKDVRIQTLGTYHDSSSGLQRGKNGVWIIDADGVRIVHLGDLGHQLNRTQLKKLGKVDVLMIPVGGVYTINGLEAQKVVEDIKPRRWVLPMHYGTLIYTDLLPLKYFLDEQPEGTPIERRPKAKGKAWISVDAKTPLPKHYTVGILPW
jgi:L-ascorbate metabolism protein UlaG (beta-lactamase superfamily)